jgi:hypothetical protein
MSGDGILYNKDQGGIVLKIGKGMVFGESKLTRKISL